MDCSSVLCRYLAILSSYESKLKVQAQRRGSVLSPTPLQPWHWWPTPRPSPFTPGKDPVPVVQESRRSFGSVWTGAENLAATGIPSSREQYDCFLVSVTAVVK